ncbi:VP3 protein [Rotavirus A]|uniref:Protein VP3 n=1 Tax=Rotavirus A TaxID=28875 RepID=A0A0P0YJV9_9REOV|nr:VP3 protein [Rotavirus A]
MKVLALRRDLVSLYADTQLYEHDDSKDYYENAYLISNITSHNVLYTSYSEHVLTILNQSGISAIIVKDKHELETLIKSNYTYDYEANIVYLHDYSYYSLNEIRTDQYWFTTTNIEEFLPPGWKLTYVGPLGIKTRGHYTHSFICQNTATDDDLVNDYVYSSEVDFLPFLLQSLNKRLTTSLQFDRMSNRLFRPKLLQNLPSDLINIGPPNESMCILLKYPSFTNFPSNDFRVSDLISLRQERWVGKINTQFDIGQYKNMCNVLATIYLYYNKFHAFPKVYMLGSAPSYWIKDVNEYKLFNYETWDPLDTPFSKNHHKEIFTLNDVSKLQDNSILYIDIRTDKLDMDWREWRDKVERETLENLEIMYKYLSNGKRRICCCKITAMDLELPVDAYLLHFPTTKIQSELYIICTQDALYKKRFVPKGSFYAFINNTLSSNVFIGPTFKLKETSKYLLALYALSNENNDKEKILKMLERQKRGIVTLRLNNTFDAATKANFKDTYDYLYLPTELPMNKTVVTSYSGLAASYGLSVSLEHKATGNNHLFISLNDKDYDQVDLHYNHMAISRRSHSIRFSESATTLSGYMFRDITNGKFNLIDTNVENSVSGHVYNALIYFRYNYTFDLRRWIYLHAQDNVKIRGGKYYEHAPPELLYACETAKTFARTQNDQTLLDYINGISKLIKGCYSITYADDPNYYISITFEQLPYKYTVSDPHLTGGLFDISESQIQNVVDILKAVKHDIETLELSTSYTFMLTDSHYVANVNGYSAFYYKLYMLFYRDKITFGQSRMFIPHITLSKNRNDSMRIQSTGLKVKSISLKRIKSDICYQI